MTPMTPSPDCEETLQAQDGIKLHVEHFLPEGPARLALVFIHGYTTHTGLYRQVGASFARSGIATTHFDCRGHGRSGGRRAYIAHFNQYVEDLTLVIARARARHPDLPWALLGHSQGSAIALEAVLHGGLAPTRLVLAAPWLAHIVPLPAWKRALGRVTNWIWPTFPHGNELRPENASRNALAVEYFQKDPLLLRIATPRWYYQLLEVQQRLRAAPGRLAVPTMFLLAGQDRIVSTQAALDFARAAPGTRETKIYPELYHELFLEPEREQVLADVAGWLCSTVEVSGEVDRSADELPAILPSRP
jgi:acylglycerol lipase